MKGTKKESILFSFTRCEIDWDDYEMSNQVEKKKSSHGDSQHADTSKYLSLFVNLVWGLGTEGFPIYKNQCTPIAHF